MSLDRCYDGASPYLKQGARFVRLGPPAQFYERLARRVVEGGLVRAISLFLRSPAPSGSVLLRLPGRFFLIDLCYEVNASR